MSVRSVRVRAAGQAMVEYALLLMLLALAAALILWTLGGAIGNVFSTIVRQFPLHGP